MKHLLIAILLFMVSCSDNKKEQEKIIELQNVITSVEKQDFSIFDKYFSKDKLYPVFSLQDTVFTNIDHTNIYTDIITYSNNGEPLVYSNQYGMIFYEKSKRLVSLQEISNISKQLQLPEFKFLGAGDLADMYTDIYNLDLNSNIDSQLRNSPVTFDQLVLGARDKLLPLISYFEDPANRKDSKNGKLLRELGNQLDYKLRIEFGKSFNQYLLKKVIGETFDEQRNAIANTYIKRLYPKDIQNTNGILEVVMNTPVWY